MDLPLTPAPEGPSHAAVADAVQRVLRERGQLDGALLPVLHGVQEALGHIPREAVQRIAEALNLSRAEVHGVVTYYHHFRTEAPGRTVVQVCRAESCRAMGGEELLAHARLRTGCDASHHTSTDGAWSVEPAYCLGLCASSPAVMVGDRVHARMTPARLDQVLGVAA